MTRLAFGIAVTVLGVRLGLDLMASWPPRWLEKMQHREEAAARVEALGGWATLERECIALMQAHTNQYSSLDWRRIGPGDYLAAGILRHRPEDTSQWTNQPALPPVLAGLNARQVSVKQRATGNWMVELKLFGFNATGSRGQAPYRIFVFCPEWQGQKETGYLGRTLRAVSPLTHEEY